MVVPEKVLESMKATLPLVKDLMEADYEKVHAAISKRLSGNKEGTKYTYTVKVEFDVSLQKQSVDTAVSTEWPLEGKGKNHKDGPQILLDKPLGPDKLEGVDDDFGRSLPPGHEEGEEDPEE